MTDFLAQVTALARDLVAIDSRSFVSNLPIAARIEAELAGFEVERLDYLDPAGVAKRVLVAHRPSAGGTNYGGIAFSGHMDTVPDTGWTTDPFSAAIDGDTLHGLGSTDMKGAVAAIIVAAQALPAGVPVTLLITTDEETTKQGARVIAERSLLLARVRPAAIIVAEPTDMAPVRGHRSHIAFTAVATGIQAHSSTGEGKNANWALIPFLVEMKTMFERLQTDPAMQDRAYDPPFSDFNLILDNHGAAVNVTVPVATARIKFRYSARIDPQPVIDTVRAAAAHHGIALTEAREGAPPELPADHPLVVLCSEVTGFRPRTAPYGTDASILQMVAPCVILGPGGMGGAHKPGELASLAELAGSVVVFMQLAARLAQSWQ
jgi:acetylornithine deacetylase